MAERSSKHYIISDHSWDCVKSDNVEPCLRHVFPRDLYLTTFHDIIQY